MTTIKNLLPLIIMAIGISMSANNNAISTEKAEINTKNGTEVLVLSNSTTTIELPVATDYNGATTLDKLKEVLSSVMGTSIDLKDISGAPVYVTRMMYSLKPALLITAAKQQLVVECSMLDNINRVGFMTMREN